MTASRVTKRQCRDRGFACALLLVAPAFGQQKGQQALPVITVCEALEHIALYRDKNVVVVGLSNWTFEGSFIHERCESDGRILVQGYRWPSAIELSHAAPASETSESFPVDEAVLRAKVARLSDYHGSASDAVARRQDSTVNGIAKAMTSGEWIAAYGKLESPAKLRQPIPPSTDNARNTPGNGYGANGSVPARLLLITSRAVPPKD